MQPSLKDLLALQYSRKLCGSMMIKLSPAIDYKKVSAEYFGESGLFPDKNHSWTFVEEDNILKEVLLTTGLLADEVKYNAVLLSCKKELSGTGEEKINIAGWQKYLYEPAKAVIRAGLVQKLGLEFDLELVDENLALLSSDNLVFSPSFKVYQVKDVYKYHKRLLQDLCREHAVGELVIKTRGFPQTTEQIRSKLKLKGSVKLTVIIVRRNKGHQLAIIDKV